MSDCESLCRVKQIFRGTFPFEGSVIREIFGGSAGFDGFDLVLLFDVEMEWSESSQGDGRDSGDGVESPYRSDGIRSLELTKSAFDRFAFGRNPPYPRCVRYNRLDHTMVDDGRVCRVDTPCGSDELAKVLEDLCGFANDVLAVFDEVEFRIQHHPEIFDGFDIFDTSAVEN